MPRSRDPLGLPLVRGSTTTGGSWREGQPPRASTRTPAAGWESGAPRFLLYSHDALGLGHVRRNLVIAGKLVERCPEASVLLATSAEHADSLGVPDGVDLMRLPAMRKVGNGHYTPRRLPISTLDLTALRSCLLAAAIESYRPSVLLVDKQPLGVGGELRPALGRLRKIGGRAVLGLRDVLDDPVTVRKEWTPAWCRLVLEHYPRVLVYGSETVIDTIRFSALPPELVARSRYCGYVTMPVSVTRGQRRRYGARPGPRSARRARDDRRRRGRPPRARDVHRRIRRRAVGDDRGHGPAALACRGDGAPPRAAGVGVAIRTFVPELAGWFGAVDAVVCMGGYNTLCEVLVRGTPTVCVPRTVPRTEQLIRARAFEALGLVQVVEPDRLDGPTLRAEIELALTRSRHALKRKARRTLRFDGAETAVECLLAEAAKSCEGRAA